MPEPLEALAHSLFDTNLIRHFHRLFEDCPDLHMKDMTVEEVGPGRRVKIEGQWVVNFGSDSFLGLDRDPRLQKAVQRGVMRWGTHNGSSRAFASVAANVEAERRLARWIDRKSTRLNSSHSRASRMPSSA